MSVRIGGGNFVLKSTVTTFDQALNSTTATATAADVSVGSLTLLTDAITAIGTLQSAINLDRHLLNKVIDVLQASTLAG